MATQVSPALQAEDAFVIQPSDTDLIVDDSNNTNEYQYCSIYCGNASTCNIDVVLVNGATVTFKNVQPGSFLPIAVKQVKATLTTAAAATLIALVSKSRV